MRHACFYTICLVFHYTLWHFYAFSGTNLLTSRHSASSLFLCFRKVTQEIFSELDETKASRPEFYRSFERTKEETEWGHEVASHQGGVARGWAAPPMLETASVHSWWCPFAYKDPPTRRSDQFSRTHRDLPSPSTRRSGGSRSSFRHPAGEGNRHRRSFSSPCLPPERWVSGLPWTMDP
jgi:hypothetical protein